MSKKFFYGGLVMLYLSLSVLLIVGCDKGPIESVHSSECQEWLVNPGHYDVYDYHYLGEQQVVFDFRVDEFYSEEYWLNTYNSIVQTRNQYNLNIGVWLRVIYQGDTVGYVLSDGTHFAFDDARYIDSRVSMGE